MQPIRYDFQFWTNADYSESLTFSDTNGTPVDLTDHSAKAQFRVRVGDTSTVLNFPTLSIVDNAFDFTVTKEVLLAAYNASISNATFGQPIALIGDFVITLPSGDDEVWIESKAVINYGVTH